MTARRGAVCDDLLRRDPGRRGSRHDRRYPHQCGARRHLDLPQAAHVHQARRAVLALASAGNLSVTQSVALAPDRGRRGSGYRQAGDDLRRADDVPRGPADRPRDPESPGDRARRVRGGAAALRGVVPVRRPDRRRADAALHDLLGRQLPSPAARTRRSCRSASTNRQADLDRAVTFKTDIYDALKVGLVSMDSTMRSNLGVGLPIDLTVIRATPATPRSCTGSRPASRISTNCASAGRRRSGRRTGRSRGRLIGGG